MIPRILEKYRKEVASSLMEKFDRQNRLAVPRLKKIVINMGVGGANEDIKILEAAMADLARLSGQKPVIRRSKKAISNFKIRKGDPVACSVTLRGTKMYEFFDRLVNVALPRVRDFRGISNTAFDEAGNYTLGVSEQSIFPEIELDKISRTQGMDIVMVTSTSSREESKALLKALGMPFRE